MVDSGFGKSLDLGFDLQRQEEIKKKLEEQRAREIENRDNPKKTFDWSRHATLACLLVILIVGGISLSQTLRIPAIDKRARLAVQQEVISAARQEVEKNWPLLSPEGKAKRVKQVSLEILKSSKTKKKKELIAGQNQLVYRTVKGFPYVYDLDSYYFLALAAGLETGRQASFNPLVWLEKTVYSAWHNVDPLITLSDAAFFLPLVFGLLTLVFFFFLTKRITGSVEAAFFAGLVLALHHRFFFATAAGMADSQSINLLFSALFFFFVILAVNAWREQKKAWSLAHGLFALVVFWLFQKTWGNGAFYVLALIVASAVVLFTVKFLKARAWARLGLLYGALVLGLVLVGLNKHGVRVLNSYVSYLGFSETSVVKQQIGELFGQNVQVWAVALGGWLVVLLAVGAWFWLARKNLKQKLVFGEVFVLVWFVLLAFATYRAIRFNYYAVLPTALLVGLALSKAANGLRAFFDVVSVRGKLAVLATVLVFAGILTIPYLVQTQQKVVPKMNDAIASVGSAINARARPDARLISWWDYGHVWRYAAKRNPYVDGGMQGHEATFWIAKAFLSSNPDQARKVWELVGCRELGWLGNELINTSVVNEPCQKSVPQAFVVVDELMISDNVAPGLVQLVSAYDLSFASKPVKTSKIVGCSGVKELLECGGVKVSLDSLTADGSVAVHYFVNGTRFVSNKSSERVMVVFESKNNFYGFVTDSWFANTVLVRLLAGERLLEPVFFTDLPVRIAAYEFVPERDSEKDFARVTAEGLTV